MIAISGFLSANSDGTSDWVHLINFCRVRGLPLYQIRWQSSTQDDIHNIVAEKAQENKLNEMASSVTSFKSLFTAKNVGTLANYVGGVIMDSTDTFKTARNNARITGKLLAHFLSSEGHIFGDHTFSLIGFSLGSQVVKSTINRLSKIGKTNLIHNAYFLAGATYVKK